jgi:hypothetical protein
MAAQPVYRDADRDGEPAARSASPGGRRAGRGRRAEPAEQIIRPRGRAAAPSPRRRRPAAAAGATAIAALALLAAGCGTSGGGPAGGGSTAGASSTPRSPAATAGASSPAAATAAAAGAGCDQRPWRAAPVTVTRDVPVPPVPVITAVRAAQHPECGYDRLVLSVTGPLPGYAIRYATQVTADGSGAAISLPGRRYLLITMPDAQAHTASGAATVVRGVQRAGFPMLASWTVAGDFEGVVTIAVGLNDATSVRVGELPGRLYVDFRS